MGEHPRPDPHFSPTYASWLNQQVRWLGLLSERALTCRQGLHEVGQRDSEAVRLETKSADERLSSPEGYCQRTCETGRQFGPVWFQMVSPSATQLNCCQQIC